MRIARAIDDGKTLIQLFFIPVLPPFVILRLAFVKDRDVIDDVVAQRGNEFPVRHVIGKPASGPLVALAEIMVGSVPIVAVGNTADELTPSALTEKIRETPAQTFHGIASIGNVYPPACEIALRRKII